MKKIILISVIICLSLLEIVNAQNWQWSHNMGGVGSESGRVCCISPNGDVYIAGKFSSNPCHFLTDTLIPNGYDDFFIAKYDGAGNELWVKSFGGANNQIDYEGINSIAYNIQLNSVFISGAFWGTCSFDTYTLTSNGMNDAFVAKLDQNGNVTWVVKSGGSNHDYAPVLNLDNAGNLYVEYTFSSSGYIDTTQQSSGVYLVKYNSIGHIQWIKKKFNTNGTAIGYDAEFAKLKVKDDKIFAIGLCTVDTLTVDTITVYSNFPNGQYILGCFDTSGTALWVKNCANENLYANFGLDIDANKNCYITGSFSQSAIFNNDTIFNNNMADMFLAKYDSVGNFIWVKQTNSTISSGGYDVSLSSDAGVYVTGFFYGTATFGAFTINSVANGNMFVTRYDTSGICIGVRHLGPSFGWAIATDNYGDFYCTGNFQNTVTFPSNSSLSSYGLTDVYIAKSSAITGLEEKKMHADNRLIIYANPNKGTCNVTIPDEFNDDKDLTLQIFDNTGKLLQQTKVEMQQEKIKINIEEEAKGVYNVTLSNKKKSYNGKIVFE